MPHCTHFQHQQQHHLLERIKAHYKWTIADNVVVVVYKSNKSKDQFNDSIGDVAPIIFSVFEVSIEARKRKADIFGRILFDYPVLFLLKGKSTKSEKKELDQEKSEIPYLKRINPRLAAFLVCCFVWMPFFRFKSLDVWKFFFNFEKQLCLIH